MEVLRARVAGKTNGCAQDDAIAGLQSDEFSKRLRCFSGPANAFAANTKAETATNKTVRGKNEFAK
jgi:hypothetical protein